MRHDAIKDFRVPLREERIRRVEAFVFQHALGRIGEGFWDNLSPREEILFDCVSELIKAVAEPMGPNR